MIEKSVKSTIIKHTLLEKGDYVIVGLSGGPDSMCLFSVLLDIKDELELNISAVHVNHMLRPIDAQKDQEYVEEFCANTKIPCKVNIYECAKIAKERGLTDEEAGRNLRYEAFYEAAQELITCGIPEEKIKIAVAQNKNDQAETLLLRILRGTGINGLSGIEYKRMGEFGTTIIRPLLDIERQDIEKYCAEKAINPCGDYTNDEAMYTRNKIRLELIPYLHKNFNENIIETLVRLTQSAKEDNEYLWKQAKELKALVAKETKEIEPVVNAKEIIALERTQLKQLDIAMRRRVILLAFQEIGLTQDILTAHLNMIEQVLFSESASAKVNLPNNYEMMVSYDTVILYLTDAENEQYFASFISKLTLSLEVLTIDEYYGRGVKSEPNMKNGYGEETCDNVYTGSKKPKPKVALDYDKLKATDENAKANIVLRNREQGDYFVPQGMKTGKKKMQDYFVDRKIPKENREFYKLIALGKEILWVFDPVYNKHSEINEKYKLTCDTKNVLVLEIT